MSSTDNLRSNLEKIPNSVSGDGRNFVAQLKKYLQGFRDTTQEKIDGIGAGAAEQAFGLRLTELHERDSKGQPINNIYVEFDNTNVTNYLNAQIWMRTSSENAFHMVGTTNSVTYTIPDVKAGATYFVKVVACNTNSGTADFDTAPVTNITILGSVLIPDAPTQFFLTWDQDGALWQWQFNDNGYVDYFELRMDGHAGAWDDSRLDCTRNSFSRETPTVRSGTAYLFIRNIFGDYSLPATHTFNIAAPAKPQAPTLEMTLDGVVITMDPLPAGCTGYKLEITDAEDVVDTFESSNNQFVYFQFMGSISVRYCFVDAIGKGEWSDSMTGEMKTVLNLFEIPEISYDKFDTATKTAVDKANTALTQIETLQTTTQADIQGIINNLNKGPDGTGYAAIAQLNTSQTQLRSQLLEIITAQGEGTSTEISMLQSQVTQNSSSINTIVENLNASPTGNTYSAISSLKQQADSIATTVQTNKTTQDAKNSTFSSDISQLQQTATGLSSTVQSNKLAQDSANATVNTKISNLQQTATGLSSTVQTLTDTTDNLNSRVTANASNIMQTSNSITAVVTELNKTNPALSKYSSISALANGIDLCVKDTDLTGREIVNRINIQPTVTTIDGKFLHVTGNTLFDNSVIVSGAIAVGAVTNAKIGTGAVTETKLGAGAVTSGKVKDGAVTAVKISDGAVIADKIAVNAVTSAKISANAITSDKINTGAITAGKIATGAITATKMAANSVTTAALQAGSIIGSKISAGAIGTEHLAARNIDLTGALKIIGGNVTLSEAGLRLTNADSSYTIFNAEGINYVDQRGVTYAQVKRMIIGRASDGDYIRFSAPWTVPPSVMCVPTNIQTNDISYPSASLFIVCEPSEISVNGFRVNNYLKIGAGSNGITAQNKSYTFNTSSNFIRESMTQYWYGNWRYSYDFKVYTDILQFAVPTTATRIEMPINFSQIFSSYMQTYYQGRNSGATRFDAAGGILSVELYVGGVKRTQYNIGLPYHVSYEDGYSINRNFTLSATFPATNGSVALRLRWTVKLTTNDHGSWSTLYNGYNGIAQGLAYGAKVTIPYCKYAASDAKIARGQCMFLVTDGSTNYYTIEH